MFQKLNSLLYAGALLALFATISLAQDYSPTAGNHYRRLAGYCAQRDGDPENVNTGAAVPGKRMKPDIICSIWWNLAITRLPWKRRIQQIRAGKYRSANPRRSSRSMPPSEPGHPGDRYGRRPTRHRGSVQPEQTRNHGRHRSYQQNAAVLPKPVSAVATRPFRGTERQAMADWNPLQQLGTNSAQRRWRGELTHTICRWTAARRVLASRTAISRFGFRRRGERPAEHSRRRVRAQLRVPPSR